MAPIAGPVAVLLGIALLVGTAGASDLGGITPQQTMIRILIALGLIGGGITWARICARLEDINERKEKHECNY